jgi:hypothetical protein
MRWDRNNKSGISGCTPQRVFPWLLISDRRAYVSFHTRSTPKAAFNAAAAERPTPLRYSETHAE